MKDQATLAKEVLENPSEKVREDALAKLTDEGMLAKVARTSRDDFIRRSAARRLTDEKVLAELAENDQDARVRFAALKRISDRTIVSRLTEPAIVHAVEQLKRTQTWQTWSERCEIANTIAQNVDGKMVALLVEAMKDERPFLHEHASGVRRPLVQRYSSLVGKQFPEEKWTTPRGFSESDCGLLAALAHATGVAEVPRCQDAPNAEMKKASVYFVRNLIGPSEVETQATVQKAKAVIKNFVREFPGRATDKANINISSDEKILVNLHLLHTSDEDLIRLKEWIDHEMDSQGFMGR